MLFTCSHLRTELWKKTNDDGQDPSAQVKVRRASQPHSQPRASISREFFEEFVTDNTGIKSVRQILSQGKATPNCSDDVAQKDVQQVLVLRQPT